MATRVKVARAMVVKSPRTTCPHCGRLVATHNHRIRKHVAQGSQHDPRAIECPASYQLVRRAIKPGSARASRRVA